MLIYLFRLCPSFQQVGLPVVFGKMVSLPVVFGGWGAKVWSFQLCLGLVAGEDCYSDGGARAGVDGCRGRMDIVCS